MAELNTALNDLLKGKRPEDNLKIYTEGLFSLYKRMAHLRLSMNYFTFSEICSELNENHKTILESSIEKVQQMVELIVFTPGCVNDSMIESIDELRNEMIETMEVLTAYVDRFQIFEYMLNRVEFRFSDSGFTDLYYKESFADDIIKYITSEKDNGIINMKISQVVAQLPMRLSKNKFYDMIKDSVFLYKNSDVSALEEFRYMVRTSGALLEPDGFQTLFPDLYEVHTLLLKGDYEGMNGEEYKKLRTILDDATVLVEDYSDAHVMFVEVINDLYSLVLCGTCLYDQNETDRLTSIMKDAYAVIAGEKDIYELDPEVFQDFVGLQEKIGSMIMRPESALGEIWEKNLGDIQNLGFQDAFLRLKKIGKLQSVSNFAELDRMESDQTMDDQYLMDTAAELANEFTQLFSSHGNALKRAVMASVIGNLPSFFHNMEELQKYIQVALEQCRDSAERQACMALIHLMITSE